MTELGMLDTEIETHQNLIRETKTVLREEEDWIKTPELHDQVKDRSGLEDGYVRSLLTYVRQHLENQDEIEVKTRREGGDPTYYWRIEN